MVQRREAQSLGQKEKESIRLGVEINFPNPEVLRAYILAPQASRHAPTLAERMSGIKEIPLGEFPLDGNLFSQMKFTLIIEPDRNPHSKGERPTAIIRADIQLGKADSNLKKLQVSRANKERIEEPKGIMSVNQLTEYKGKSISMQEWSRNTSRIHFPLTQENFGKSPFVLLQIWDKDVGIGSISISLVSIGEYSKQWRERYYQSRQREADGWEVDKDEEDRWQFKEPIGVNAYDMKGFKEAIEFYEKAFPEIIQVLYKAEGIDVPDLSCEIESPMIFREHKEITFSEIGGQSNAVKKLLSRVRILQSRAKIESNVPILLYGPPGNGKTSLAQAVANELQAPLLVKTSRDLSPTAQDSDFFNLLEAGYLEAKAAAKVGGGKAVYCIEGVEILVGEGLKLQDRFLNLMDEWQRDTDNSVLIIATSNFPQNLHPGIISRFDAIPIPQPNAAGRKEILEIHAKKINEVLGQNIFASVDMDRVAERLDGFSGRDIEKILAAVCSLGRLESQEKGGGTAIDTNFILKLVPDRRIGFKTS